MTFTAPNPNRPLQVIVDMAFGFTQDQDPATYVWTDVSAYVRGSVSITKGKQYQPGQVTAAQPCEVSFTLDNNKGYFTPDNPLSPFYPNVVVGVPVRVRLTWQNAVTSYERIVTFVTGWPIQPNAGMTDVVSPIVAQGRLRRLGRPGKPAASPLRQAITAAGPIAYWTMEDGAAATSAASAIAGQPAMVPYDSSPTFGATGSPGSVAAVSFTNGGSLQGAVYGGSSTSWTVEFQMQLGATSDPGTSNLQRFLNINTNGSDSLFQVGHSILGGVSLLVYEPDATNDFFGNDATLTQYDGAWHTYVVTAAKSGANTNVAVAVDGVTVISGTIVGQTCGRVISVLPAPHTSNYLASGQGSMEHLAVYNGLPSINHTAPLGGYVGELATDRVTRICAGASIPVAVTTGAVAAQPMGAQTVDTVGNLIGAVEQVDCGFLHDGGPLGKLAYVAGPVRYNAAAAFTLDYKRGHLGDGLLGGSTDTQIANDWTISVPGGSQAEASDAESVTAVGEFDQSASAAVVDVNQALQLAGWKAHLGGYRGALFPQVQVDLRRSPELAEAMTNLTLPAHIGIANLPLPWYPPTNLDQFAEGYTEVIDAVTWQIVFNTSPFPPYQVFVLDDPILGKLDLEQTTLHTSKTAVAVGTVESWSIDTVVGLLSTAGGDYPVDWVCDGERVTVTAVSGGASPQTATVTRGVNGITRAHSAGAHINLWVRPVLAL